MNAMPVGNESLVIQGAEANGMDSGLRILARMIARKYANERAALNWKEEILSNVNLCNK
jgi:hypothetical protein